MLLSTLDGALGIRGWRWLLAVEGVPTVLLGIAAPFLLYERPHTAPWLSKEERASLVGALEKDETRRRRKRAATSSTDPTRAKGDAVGPSAASMHGAPRLDDSSPSLMRTLQTTLAGDSPTRVFCAQYVVSAAIANSARFFLPTLLKEVFPRMPPWGLGLVFAVPALLKIVLSPPLAAWADGGGERRRKAAALGLYASAAGLLVGAGAGMLLGGGGSGARWCSASLIGVVAIADVLCQLAIPVFWSLHHGLVEGELRGCSIAVVNSVGNGVGGFLGPWLVGVAHDATSAAYACGTSTGGCTAQWGWGTIGLGAATLAGTTVCSAILDARLTRHGFKHRLSIAAQTTR